MKNIFLRKNLESEKYICNFALLKKSKKNEK